MERKTRVLLTNAFAVNNGDMALVLALHNQLIQRGYDVSIATFYYSFLKKKYPTLPLIRELLDYNWIPGSTIIRKLFLRVNFWLNKKYRNHDVFIGSPGGYLNSYYGIKRCLLPLVLAKAIHKKTAVYSQSVGPLNLRDQKLLTRYGSSIDLILVRDDYSRKCIESVYISSRVFQTKDAAFLLEPRQSSAPSDCRKVAVSVREWSHDDRNMNHFQELVVNLCQQALLNGFELEFISTCQGVPDYRDDSKVAATMRDLLVKRNPEYETRISVFSGFSTFHELANRLNKQYCFSLGTRLHMCILSLIQGIPAFNISYEVKGIECYRYLGLEQYSADYNEALASANRKFESFLMNFKAIQEQLPQIIGSVHKESEESLEKFIREMRI